MGAFQHRIAALLDTASQTLAAGNVRDAAALADEALDLAQHDGSPAQLASAHQVRFFTAHCLGDYQSAEEHYTAWRRIWEPDEALQSYHVRDGLIIASLRALFAGYDDVARQLFREADLWACRSGDPDEMAGVLVYESLLYSELEEHERAEDAATEGLGICEELGLDTLAAIARATLGRSCVERGHSAEGLELMRRGISALIATDRQLPVPALKYMFSQACIVVDCYDDALEAAEEGLQCNPHVLAYQPEGLTARGRAHFQLGHMDLAARAFNDAIELAQRTQARLSELRAATSLAQLLSARGDIRAARETLKNIHAWFVGREHLVAVRRANELMQRLNVSEFP